MKDADKLQIDYQMMVIDILGVNSVWRIGIDFVKLLGST